MQKYIVREYQRGFEQEQARIGIQVAREWIWPYAYDLDDLLKARTRPDFDPDTRHYCFLGDEMVGYILSTITRPGADGAPIAVLDFPRMMPGHEQAAALLIEKAIEILREKGVSCIDARVTTMCPVDIKLAEASGFSIYDWGYKLYYTYEMGWGDLKISTDAATDMDPEKDLQACAGMAALWYKRSPEWCCELLQEWHQMGIITHVGVRERGKLVASCLTAPNVLRPSTAANYYIYTPDEHYLKPMLAQVVKKCKEFGTHNVIADLVNEHRQYEPVYQALGFRKVAEWARCRKTFG
jgi:hypothetical protein